MVKYYVASVDWISPSGRYPSRDKLLSLPVEMVDDTGYAAFSNERLNEEYVFDSLAAAESFKRNVLDRYEKDPQYFVIDDNHNVVEEDGKPVIAWQPEISIQKISLSQAKNVFPDAFLRETDAIQ